MISGFPTTASACCARLSVKVPASAGAAGAPSAMAAAASATTMGLLLRREAGQVAGRVA
jgi:hypothetical protein